MPGFASFSDYLNETTVNGKTLSFDFYKIVASLGYIATTSAGWYSLWMRDGKPSAGSLPASAGSGTGARGGTTRTNATGSINFANQLTDKKHLVGLGVHSAYQGMMMLYDRLADVGSIAISSAGSPLNCYSPDPLPRYANGEGVEVWAEANGAALTGLPTVQMLSYTNQDGTAGRTGPGGTPESNQAYSMWKLPLQGGDRGVRSVETIQAATASATGTINIVLIKPIAYLSVESVTWVERDFVTQIPALPRILDGASLGLAMRAYTSNIANIHGQLRLAWG
jgi:hypothetical protein